jgi:hypothetical protein
VKDLLRVAELYPIIANAQKLSKLKKSLSQKIDMYKIRFNESMKRSFYGRRISKLVISDYKAGLLFHCDPVVVKNGSP